MKKFYLGILLAISCFFMAPSGLIARAESQSEDLVISTLYPKEVEYDYHSLNGISQVSVTDTHIAYTTNKTDIVIYDVSTRKSQTIGGFSNIYDMKFVSGKQLIIVDYQDTTKTGSVKVINLKTTTPTTTPLNGIDIDNLKQIDIYEKNHIVYLGLIRETESDKGEFELYQISNSNGLRNPTSHHKNQSKYYKTSSHLTISNSAMYMIDTESKILVSQHSTEITTTPQTTISGVKHLKYLVNNNQEYLIAFTEENLYILSESDYFSRDNYFSDQSMSLQDFTDIDVFENTIYICDRLGGAIRSFQLSSDSTLSNPTLLLASRDSALGRFDGVKDIYVQGDKIFASDSQNNRVQMIENSQTSVETPALPIDSNPHGTILDENQNMFVIIDNNNTSTSTINKYTQSNNAGTKAFSLVQHYSTYDDTPLGLSSDSAIDKNNVIYILDYTRNNLVELSNAGLQKKLDFSTITNPITLTSDSKLEYLIEYNMLALYNGGTIYLIDLSTPTTQVSSQLTYQCTDITTDLDSIYTINDTLISKITINQDSTNTTMQLSENSLENDYFQNFSTIACDISNSRMYAFDNGRQCINYFDCELMENPFDFANFNSSTPLSDTAIPLAIKMNNGGIIYQDPYNLGNYFTQKTHCIGIGTFEDYYRVLFENDNTLECGFLHKKYVRSDGINNIITFNKTRKLKVITTNQQVPIYKYPTILKVNNQAVITQHIPINTYITVSYEPFPIKIDGKQFYLYEKDNAIGFVFNADIVLNDGTNITYLHTENATASAIGQEEIEIYDEDKTTVIKTINNSERIYVEKFDKNSEYTKIIYKDADLNSVEGYIKTEYVQMDKLDNTKIVLILIITFSLIILCIIVVSYIVIKKRK